jgi:DNA-binding response OmpR family regulator
VEARVLVVDDNSAMRDVVSRMLKCAGYEVLLADGPRQGLEIVKNNPPVHLIVLDIMMPEMLGTALIREVARLSPQTAVVLMTASANSVALPSDVPVLKKPFSIRELLSAVQAILARSAQAALQVSVNRTSKSPMERLEAEARGAVPVGLPVRQLLDAGWSYRINAARGWVIYRDPETGQWHSRDEAIRVLEAASTVSLVGS